jgi:hypothetical protein
LAGRDRGGDNHRGGDSVRKAREHHPPDPDGDRAHAAAREYGFYENLPCEEPEIDRYVPDLGVWPVEYVDRDDQWVFEAEMCALAIEVTSPDQAKRDYAKAAGYARAGVPVYLIVDRTLRVCVVLTEPEGGGTRIGMRAVRQAGHLPLDPPVTLDTSDF